MKIVAFEITFQPYKNQVNVSWEQKVMYYLLKGVMVS